MTGAVSVPAWLACGYAGALLVVAYAIDAMARRASRSSRLGVTAGFTYHEDHDAWQCPQDQWLWPRSFDPENRILRYRATASVCNSCPVKSTCTASSAGREIVRPVDPWPASEAARFHRGIACAVAVMGMVWPIGMAVTRPVGVELAVLVGVAFSVAAGSLPLFAHLRRTPALFPDHVAVRSIDENETARALLAAAERRRRARYRSSQALPWDSP